MFKLLVVFFVLLIAGCNDDGSANEVKVDLIGVWNYSATTQNFPCDGVEAIGILTIHSLNGDLSRIGDITMQGENLELDEDGNCYLGSVDITIKDAEGEPSSQTANEYANVGDPLDEGTKSYTVPVFEENRIIEVTEYDNGVILTIVLIR